jgi:hypothetical protein
MQLEMKRLEVEKMKLEIEKEIKLELGKLEIRYKYGKTHEE